MSAHPKVYWAGPDGEFPGGWFVDDWMEDDDEPALATHKVVPLDALVIERDDNGKWPEWVRSAAEDGAASGYCDAFGGFDENRYNPESDWRHIARAVLDALEAAQKEKP